MVTQSCGAVIFPFFAKLTSPKLGEGPHPKPLKPSKCPHSYGVTLCLPKSHPALLMLSVFPAVYPFTVDKVIFSSAHSAATPETSPVLAMLDIFLPAFYFFPCTDSLYQLTPCLLALLSAPLWFSIFRVQQISVSLRLDPLSSSVASSVNSSFTFLNRLSTFYTGLSSVSAVIWFWSESQAGR